MCSARIEDKIYIFGGGNNSDSTNTKIYELNTNDDTITLVSGVSSTGRAAIAIKDKIYAMGQDNDNSLSGGGSSSIIEIDIKDKTKTSVANHQQRIIDTTLAAYENLLFIFGGRWGYRGEPLNGHPWISGSLSDIYCLDTETYTLEKLPTSLPAASYGSTAVTIGENIYLFGGSATEMQKSIYKFNVKDYSLTKMDEELPGKVSYLQAAYAGWDKGVYIPNIPITGGQKIHRFVLESYLPYGTLYLQSTLTNKLFEIYPNFKIGVQNAYLGDSAGEA
jgi:N-acetylneuraminic acid mutarotase